jgi:S1-C subfamily serine protease
VKDKFKGTGFFITSDGYLLTTYHCIGNYPPKISIKTCFDHQEIAKLHNGKSLEPYDIAVLKVYCHIEDYIPLGKVLNEYRGDDVVAMGYPAVDILGNEDIGIYHSEISRLRDDKKIEISHAIKGGGQSGGPVLSLCDETGDWVSKGGL